MSKISTEGAIHYPVYDMSPESVAKFAMVEELRLVSSKLDRFYNEIMAARPSEAQYHKYYQQLIDATKEIEKARKKIVKENKCQKKKNGKSNSSRSRQTNISMQGL